MCMKNVNNFQIAKVQPASGCCLAFAWSFANSILTLLIKKVRNAKTNVLALFAYFDIFANMDLQWT